MATTAYQDAVVAWNAFEDDVLGSMESFMLNVPPTLSGRLDVYKIPKCADYPTGYWFSLNTEGIWNNAEPGCEAWQKTLLCSIRFFAAPTGDEDEPEGPNQNAVEYCHPHLPLTAISVLNPNDYSA